MDGFHGTFKFLDLFYFEFADTTQELLALYPERLLINHVQGQVVRGRITHWATNIEHCGHIDQLKVCDACQ